MKILVVDDSRVMRQIVIRTLRQAGFGDHDVVEATDGQHAHEVVQAEKPDLVLSDWNRPGMTGIELLRALRSSGTNTPFAFVTSESSDEMQKIAEDGGAMFLITKPFSADTFRERFDSILG
ncbi:response regulator [Actinosynnema sp.]|uniref:response regulator n=1 Tax=Actinosynnema sp. TaxID=1872144 RepID=UPI003F8673F7